MKTTKWNYLFVFLFAFTLGFLTHWGLSQFKDPDIHVANQERIPVRPDELGAEDLMDALHRDMLSRMSRDERVEMNELEEELKKAHDRFQLMPDHDFQDSDFSNRFEEESYGLKQFLVQDINRREDSKFVYYEVPLVNEKGEKLELNVTLKDGMIEITEKASGKNHQSESVRTFSLEPGLIESRAQVINEKDKVVIKIPKKE
jgi:hypothetical protein